MLRSPRPTDEVRRQLDEYFAGERQEFELDVDLGPAREFGRAVLEQLARVPYGELTTYGTLAERAGRPRAARAVGTIMNRNPVPIVLPCHRVVGSTGSLVGYAGGLDRKRTLLELEGALLRLTGRWHSAVVQLEARTGRNHEAGTRTRDRRGRRAARRVAGRRQLDQGTDAEVARRRRSTSLQKQVKTLKKRAADDENIAVGLTLAYAVCSTAVTADAFQDTFTGLDGYFAAHALPAYFGAADAR